MAGATSQIKTADELIVIGEIRRAENELRSLGVRVKSADVEAMNAAQLNDELETVSAQLQTRKRWKGVK